MKITSLILILVSFTAVVTGVLLADAMAEMNATTKPDGSAQDLPKTPIAEKHDVFYKVRPLLSERTKVPLRLPIFPKTGDDENSIFASLSSADESSYEIILGLGPDCLGETACRYGIVRGSSHVLEEKEGARIPVKLLRCIHGYFIDAQCNAHCGDSVVGWGEDGYHYSIGIKAERMNAIIKVANSAIAAGRSAKR
jgi:hypothetical protein